MTEDDDRNGDDVTITTSGYETSNSFTFTQECESKWSQQRELMLILMTVESHKSAMNGRPVGPKRSVTVK
jgi:hypothetical protein